MSDRELHRCPRCGRLLPPTAFNRSAELRLQGYCRECQSAWYRENRTRHIANVNSNRARYRERNRTFILDYLTTHPCVDCGEPDPAVLEFDHVRGKTRLVSRLTWGSAPLDLIRAELERCEVRCVNCHMRRTALQFGWRKAREEVVLDPDLLELRH
jgi:hypothetical protein